MSHFAQVKTKMRDKSVLQAALKRMGHDVVEEVQGVQVRGYFGECSAAEFKILTSTHYDIGFVQDEEGCYTLVGDWELLPKVSGIEETAFLASVKREYARQTILKTAAEKGYSVEEKENEEGVLEMVVAQW